MFCISFLRRIKGVPLDASVGGSVEEFSPATRETRVRFPVNAPSSSSLFYLPSLPFFLKDSLIFIFFIQPLVLTVRGKPRNLNQKRTQTRPKAVGTICPSERGWKGNLKYPITLRKAKTSVPPYLPLSTGLSDPDSPQSEQILTYIYI